MKNLFVAFLLTAFISGITVVQSNAALSVVVNAGEKGKKEKKSTEKKSCCKMKAGEAKSCAGMSKDEASTDAAPSGKEGETAEATVAPASEKKSCCKGKKASSCTDKEKSDKGASL